MHAGMNRATGAPSRTISCVTLAEQLRELAAAVAGVEADQRYTSGSAMSRSRHNGCGRGRACGMCRPWKRFKTNSLEDQRVSVRRRLQKTRDPQA